MTLLSCEVVAGPRPFEAHARSQIPGTRRLYEDTDGQRSLTPAMAQFSQPGTIIRSKWTYPQFQGGSRYGNYGPPRFGRSDPDACVCTWSRVSRAELPAFE